MKKLGTKCGYTNTSSEDTNNCLIIKHLVLVWYIHCFKHRIITAEIPPKTPSALE